MNKNVRKLKDEAESLTERLSKEPIPEKMMRSHENMKWTRG